MKGTAVSRRSRGRGDAAAFSSRSLVHAARARRAWMAAWEVMTERGGSPAVPSRPELRDARG